MKQQSSSSWETRGLAVLLFSLSFSLLGLMSQFRVIARDEGYLLYAARLVAESMLPYRDFFFPQGPFIPLFYGSIFKFLSYEQFWEYGRLLSALGGSFCVLFLFLLLVRRVSLAASFILSITFLLSPLCFGWLTIAKNYSWAVAFLLASIWRLERKTSRGSSFLGGACFALSAQTRLLTAVLGPVLLCSLLIERKFREAGYFLLGCALASLPSLALYLSAPEQFIFGNLQYHQLRKSSEAEGFQLIEKLGSFLRFLNPAGETSTFSLHLLSLLVLALLLSTLCLATRKKRSLLWYCSCLLVAFQFYPTPFYAQYFVLCAPLLLLAITEDWKRLELFKDMPAMGRQVALAAICFLVVVPVMRYEIKNHISGGSALLHSGRIRDLNFKAVRAIGNYVEEQTSAEEQVLSLWPGYLLESEAKPIAGLENQFAMLVADKVDKQTKKKLRLASWGDIRTAIKRSEVALVLIPEVRLKKQNYKKLLEDSGYKRVISFGKLHAYSNSPEPLQLSSENN